MSKEDPNADKDKMLIQICGQNSVDSGQDSSSHLGSYVLEDGGENEIESNRSRLSSDSTGEVDNFDYILQDEIPYATVNETISSPPLLSDTSFPPASSNQFSLIFSTNATPLDETTLDPAAVHLPTSNN